GVVDEDVDAAEAADRGVDDPLDVVGPRQIAGDREHLRPGRAGELPGRLLERRLAARADRHPDAFLDETERDRLADAFAAPGDQRHAPLQAEIHRRHSFNRRGIYAGKSIRVITYRLEGLTFDLRCAP